MRIVQIPKRNGKFRTIYIPTREQRDKLRELVPELMALHAMRPSSRAVHGFYKDRSPVTNALEHVNREYTITFDMRDFFDTVTEELIDGMFPATLLEDVLVDGAARQGLPTSPALANLAASTLDQAILRWSRMRKAIYTRYADDLTISTDSADVRDEALRDIPLLVSVCGFQLAPEKTHVYCAKAGRRIVTGVAVDDGIHPTRSAKRRLRAARHQGNESRARGLQEWCKLRLPKAARQEWLRRLQGEYGRNMRHLIIPGLAEDMELPDEAASVPADISEPATDSPTDAAGRTRRIQLR